MQFTHLVRVHIWKLREGCPSRERPSLKSLRDMAWDGRKWEGHGCFDILSAIITISNRSGNKRKLSGLTNDKKNFAREQLHTGIPPPYFLVVFFSNAAEVLTKYRYARYVFLKHCCIDKTVNPYIKYNVPLQANAL